jgi:hypothetical protein
MEDISLYVKELKNHISSLYSLEDLMSPITKDILLTLKAIDKISKEVVIPEKEATSITKTLHYLKENTPPLREMQKELKILLNRLKQDSLTEIVAYLTELEILLFPLEEDSIETQKQEKHKIDFLKKISILKSPSLTNLQKKIISKNLQEINETYNKIVPIEKKHREKQIQEVSEKMEQIASKTLPPTAKKERKKAAG